ncbi:MAG: DUF2662 domain-containing protein, partial [Chloroflexi bacterium]
MTYWVGYVKMDVVQPSPPRAGPVERRRVPGARAAGPSGFRAPQRGPAPTHQRRPTEPFERGYRLMLEGLPGFWGRLGLVLGALALSATALGSIYRQVMAVQNVVHFLNRALHNLADLPARIDQGLRDRMRRLFFRPRGAVLPTEVRKELERVMLARENTFEEDPGIKIVPNEYVVELHAGIYQRHYQPQEKELGESWRRWLVELLDTTNNRYGDRRYRFWGPV